MKVRWQRRSAATTHSRPGDRCGAEDNGGQSGDSREWRQAVVVTASTITYRARTHLINRTARSAGGQIDTAVVGRYR